ncbi:Cerato-platanin [Schizopora paradoxa]|uniref:Cerato-platanin n=1 Tax=Schizopora paradoxa TaxID=27342 RepID=A0A0H2RTI7_9AGAM|nr:Cerato-platanin [Schizopora paradoxa]
MKLINTLSLLAVAGFALAQNATVVRDTFYDQKTLSLGSVACTILESDGFTTLGGVPAFPNIGAVPAIRTGDDPLCGTCWQLTFDGTVVNIFAVDAGRGSFHLTTEAMTALTGSSTVSSVTATFSQVAKSLCTP